MSWRVRSCAGNAGGQRIAHRSWPRPNRSSAGGIQVAVAQEKPLTEAIPLDGQALSLRGYEQAGGYQGLRRAQIESIKCWRHTSSRGPRETTYRGNST